VNVDVVATLIMLEASPGAMDHSGIFPIGQMLVITIDRTRWLLC